MALELRHFRLVTAVAETGSLAAASLRLHLTPSALSHQLRDAEERLGIRLFQRGNRRLRLTGAGEQLLESARHVLLSVAQAESALQKGAPEELLRVSTGCYTAYSWLPPVLRRWQVAHPRAELRIVLEATRQPMPALLAGQLDLALTTDPPAGPRVACTSLFKDEFVLLIPAGHRFAGRRWVGAEDLGEEHLLTYDAPRDQLDLFTRVLWRAGIEPHRHTRVPLTEALIELVRAGLGITALASWVLPRRLDGLRVVGLTRGGIRRQWQAVRLRGGRPSGAHSSFVQILRDHVRGIESEHRKLRA